jgi:hypothetical protein
VFERTENPESRGWTHQLKEKVMGIPALLFHLFPALSSGTAGGGGGGIIF